MQMRTKNYTQQIRTKREMKNLIYILSAFCKLRQRKIKVKLKMQSFLHPNAVETGKWRKKHTPNDKQYIYTENADLHK